MLKFAQLDPLDSALEEKIAAAPESLGISTARRRTQQLRPATQITNTVEDDDDDIIILEDDMIDDDDDDINNNMNFEAAAIHYISGYSKWAQMKDLSSLCIVGKPP